jgi:hypothetical protein
MANILFEPGKQATCRTCDQTIKFYVGPEGRYHRDQWWAHPELHTDTAEGEWEDEGRFIVNADGSRHRAMPKEYCWHQKNNGDYCGKPIKHEDIEAGNFACGVHMPKEIEEKERREREAENKRRQEEREEMMRWELGIYEEAYARLNAFDPETFPEEEGPRSRSRGFGKAIYFGEREKKVSMDIVILERIISACTQIVSPEGE